LDRTTDKISQMFMSSQAKKQTVSETDVSLPKVLLSFG